MQGKGLTYVTLEMVESIQLTAKETKHKESTLASKMSYERMS